MTALGLPKPGGHSEGKGLKECLALVSTDGRLVSNWVAWKAANAILHTRLGENRYSNVRILNLQVNHLRGRPCKVVGMFEHCHPSECDTDMGVRVPATT